MKRSQSQLLPNRGMESVYNRNKKKTKVYDEATQTKGTDKYAKLVFKYIRPNKNSYK